MTTTGDDMIDVAIEILRGRGALTTEKWARLVVDAGFDDIEDVAAVLERSGFERPLGRLVDGRNVALDVLLDGRVLTHRLTEQDIAADILEASDLSPMTDLLALGRDCTTVSLALHDTDELLSDRGVADELSNGVLVLERGALSGYVAGDVVALRLAGGQFTVEPAPTLDDSNVPALIRSLVPKGSSAAADSIVWQLIYEDPRLFVRPIAPLAELLADAGFERSVGLVAHAGFDFDAERIAQRARLLAGMYALDPEAGMALVAIFDVVKSVASLDHDHAVARASEMIRSDIASFERVAGIQFALAVRVMGDRHSAALDAVCAAMIDVLPSPFHVGALWIRSQVAMFDGRPLDAEAYLEKAVEIDSSWAPAALDLSRFSVVRGTRARGTSLLDSVEFDEQVAPVVEFLRHLLQEYVGPNVPVRDRISRLLFEVPMMSYQTRNGGVLDHLIGVRTAQLGDSHEAYEAAIGDSFVNDVALIEGGMLSTFMTMFGAMLPPEDVAVAELYGSVERSVFEVLAVSRRSGMTVHNIRTDDLVTGVPWEKGTRLRVGDFFCARAVTLEGRVELFGGVEPVDPARVDDLVHILDRGRVDPDELLAVVGEGLS